MSQTITIKCESCGAVLELAIRLVSLSNGKPSKKQEHRSDHNGHEFITVKEFARRVHRSPITIWARIRNRQIPDGIVFDVLGHKEIDWIAWQNWVESRVLI